MKRRLKTKNPDCILAFVLILLIICTAFNPVILSSNDDKSYNKGSNSADGDREALIPESQRLSFIALPANALYIENEILLGLNRIIQSWKKASNAIFILSQASIQSILILIYCFLYLLRKVNIDRPVISLRLGGHAPPMA